jgi:hypothetical protein
MFSLTAQVLGQQYAVEATWDGGTIVVQAPAGTAHARSIDQAVDIARRHLGVILQRAERPGVPWGLHVAAGGVAAVYGEWPMFPRSDRSAAKAGVGPLPNQTSVAGR